MIIMMYIDVEFIDERELVSWIFRVMFNNDKVELNLEIFFFK